LQEYTVHNEEIDAALSRRQECERFLLVRLRGLPIREVIEPLDLKDQTCARNKKPLFSDQGIEKVCAIGLEPPSPILLGRSLEVNRDYAPNFVR